MRFSIAPSLLEQLRAMQAPCGYTDDVIEGNDAFLLDPGLGPAFYLTSDGRVLVDMREWNGGPIREASETEALAALVVGAKKTGVVALLSLLPEPPEDAQSCPLCHGDHYLVSQGERWICPKCSGRGWVR
jgi:hypothetical protein